jgi:hypothetical protein
MALRDLRMKIETTSEDSRLGFDIVWCAHHAEAREESNMSYEQLDELSEPQRTTPHFGLGRTCSLPSHLLPLLLVSHLWLSKTLGAVSNHILGLFCVQPTHLVVLTSRLRVWTPEDLALARTREQAPLGASTLPYREWNAHGQLGTIARAAIYDAYRPTRVLMAGLHDPHPLLMHLRRPFSRPNTDGRLGLDLTHAKHARQILYKRKGKISGPGGACSFAQVKG